MNCIHLSRKSADALRYYSSSACQAEQPRRSTVYRPPCSQIFRTLFPQCSPYVSLKREGHFDLPPESIRSNVAPSGTLGSTTSALWRWRSSPSVPVRSSSGGPSERRQRLSRQSLPDPAAPGQNCRRPGETEPRASGGSFIKSLPPKDIMPASTPAEDRRRWGVAADSSVQSREDTTKRRLR